MPFFGTYAWFLCFLWALYNYLPISSISKLKFSCSSSKSELFSVSDFKRLFYFKFSFTALVTKAFSSSPLDGCFLVTWNLVQPAPLPQSVAQFDVVPLNCACMTLHKFILCPDQCKWHKDWFFFWFFVYILFWVFCGLVWLFALIWLDDLVAFTGLFRFFVLVISFTLRVEMFLYSF